MGVLVLGGTTEASRLAQALAARSAMNAVLSLAGRTEHPSPPPIPFRVGGFGGIEGLAAYLAAERMSAVVDATHPFAARISAHALEACARMGVPLVAFTRPPWCAGQGDDWTGVPDIGAAVHWLRDRPPSRVFLTTGRLDLAAFRDAPQHAYLVRTIDPPAAETIPPVAEVMLGRGPFPAKEEIALMRAHRVGLLVTKNSGGSASAAKLEAARRLSIPVLMVERPYIPDRATMEDLDSVLQWIERHDARP